MNTTDDTARKGLQELFWNTAMWRRSKSEEYPDDQRNQASEEYLLLLAKEVGKLDDSHPLIVVALDSMESTGIVTLPAESVTERMVSRAGFDLNEAFSDGPQVFFEQLAEQWREDKEREEILYA